MFLAFGTMSRARYLRRKSTDAEKILWRHLRNRQFSGYKFRRQHPIDPYVLDFYSPAAKVAIELDGCGHSYRLRENQDEIRNGFLSERGIVVLRFWNNQIQTELDNV